ncbi:MAG: class I SAM-dependent methyltransferase, partial [Hyphomicrobiaceae bacterium]
CGAISISVSAQGMSEQAPAVEKGPAADKGAGREAFVPKEGQEGKDVIWLPTAQALVDRMLDMAKMTKDDFVVDLGSGDGRTVITAARRGAQALGIEYNSKMVEFSKRNAEKAGVAERAKFQQGDIFEADFSKATVLTMFLLPDINLKLRPKILDMKPGTRVVTNSFDMGDWKADRTSTAKNNCTSYCTAYLWIVPAKVEGSWTLADGSTLKLDQTFQFINGTLTKNGKATAIKNGKLTGDRITFVAGKTTYNGRVAGDEIEGIPVKSKRSWKAVRRES